MNKLKTLFEAYQERPIAYMPIYAEITGSLVAGVVLSQIVYWDKVMKHKEYYKTDKDFCNELKMGFYEFRSAKALLKKMKIVNIQVKQVPPKTFYKLNIDRLIELMTDHISKCGKTTIRNVKKPNNITDTTTETTNNHNLSPSKKSILPIRNSHIRKHLEKNPSKNKEVDNAVDYYLASYRLKVNQTHSNITGKQWDKIKNNFDSIQEDYDLSEENWREMIDEWFDSNAKTDYNLNHFASEGVLNTGFYKSIYQ